jgi:hypothetical protein
VSDQHAGDHADRFDHAIKQIDQGMSALHGLGFIVLNRGHYSSILSQAREQRMRRHDDHRWLSRVAAGVIRTTAPVSDLLSRAEQNALAAKIAAGIIDGMKSLAGSDEVRADQAPKRTPEQQLEQLREHRANLDIEIANQEQVLQRREDV